MDKAINEKIIVEIEKAKTILVLVEGRKDKLALRNLGFSYVWTVKNKPIYKVVESIPPKIKEAIILTDLDKAGKRMYGILNDELSRRGIRVNNRLRNLLFKTPIRHIEGLATFLVKNNIVNLETEFDGQEQISK